MRRSSAVHSIQNVHSNEQMYAVPSAASSRPQRSQEGRSSNAKLVPANETPGAPHAATVRSFCDSAIAWSFFRLWFSIWRTRSRVTLNALPTSSRVRGCSPARP